MDEEQLLLLLQAQSGDENAFTIIVKRYQRWVFSITYAVLQNRTDAEDVSQEVFLRVWRALPALRDLRAFPAWIARIGIRMATASRKKRKPDVPLVDAYLQSHPDPAQNLAHSSAERMAIADAFRDLSEEHRLVLVLREIHGFDYTEIADLVDVPVGTVKSRIYNARKKLQSLLQDASEVTQGER